MSRQFEAREISDHFRLRFTESVPKKTIVTYLSSPLPGELYWFDSRYRRGAQFLRLSRSRIASDACSSNHLLHLKRNHLTGLCFLRVSCRLSDFTSACTNEQLKLLKPDVSIDNSPFGVAVPKINMERAAHAARVTAKLLLAGQLKGTHE